MRANGALVPLIGTRQKVRERLGLWVLPFRPHARSIQMVVVSVPQDSLVYARLYYPSSHTSRDIVRQGTDPQSLRLGLSAAVLRVFLS